MLEVRDVHKSFGSLEVLKGVGLRVSQGDVVAILGPSGSGKTTLLRCINFLETAGSGTMIFDGETFQMERMSRRDVARLRKKTAFVFQNYNLFRNKTALQNVTEGLITARKMPKDQAEDAAMKALRKVGMADRASHYPRQLSGGQQQRVAIARAIVSEPRLLLLDEPLSNLDAKLRVQMRTEIRKIQRTVGITAIYVTHDQAEAMSMSDRIVILKDGKISQMGTPKEVYYSPESEFSANFIGTANILHGTVQAVHPDGTLSVALLDTVLEHVPCQRPHQSGDACTLVIRPEACSVREDGLFQAEVSLSTFMGSYQLYELDLLGSRFTVHENNPKTKRIYQVGETTHLALDIRDIHVI